MAIIDRIEFQKNSGLELSVSPIMKAAIVEQIKLEIWKWYNENKERVILSKKILFFNVNLQVSHIRFIIEEIAGQENEL